mmetsp:Transcript_4520/g.16520  ORF Transcript_4520/g.16520 Transcript_4520/m.16520 type:complete len:84 (-) Transcript_4520:112-363(-)
MPTTLSKIRRSTAMPSTTNSSGKLSPFHVTVVACSRICRCAGVHGEDAKECKKIKHHFISLCPVEWIEKWNDQREAGTFPGPL